MVKRNKNLPASVAGIEWRPLSQEDAGPLYELLGQLDDAERASYRTSRDEVDAMLARDGGWHAIGGYQASDPESMVAFGYVGLSLLNKREVRCEGGVHPKLRGEGVGRTLLGWQTKTGAELVRQCNPERGGYLVHSVSDNHPKLREAIKGMGYKWAHSYAELRLEISDFPGKVKLPKTVTIEPWDPDWDNFARRTYNKAMSQIGSDTYMSSSEWDQLLDDSRRTWSFLAVDRSGDRPEVIGMLAAGAYEQDWEFLGWSEGMVELLAVVDTNLRDKLVLALVRSTMKAMKKTGIDKIVVSLDPVENEDMLQFYRALGFDVGAWYFIYRYTVPAVPNRVKV